MPGGRGEGTSRGVRGGVCPAKWRQGWQTPQTAEQPPKRLQSPSDMLRDERMQHRGKRHENHRRERARSRNKDKATGRTATSRQVNPQTYVGRGAPKLARAASCVRRRSSRTGPGSTEAPRRAASLHPVHTPALSLRGSSWTQHSGKRHRRGSHNWRAGQGCGSKKKAAARQAGPDSRQAGHTRRSTVRGGRGAAPSPGPQPTHLGLGLGEQSAGQNHLHPQ